MRLSVPETESFESQSQLSKLRLMLLELNLSFKTKTGKLLIVETETRMWTIFETKTTRILRPRLRVLLFSVFEYVSLAINQDYFSISCSDVLKQKCKQFSTAESGKLLSEIWKYFLMSALMPFGDVLLIFLPGVYEPPLLGLDQSCHSAWEFRVPV